MVYLSKYIKIFQYPENPDYILLYSTKKTVVILLHKSVMQTIEDGSVSPSNQKTLVDLGFLVDDIIKEQNEVVDFFNEANRRSRRLDAFVILNLDCNFNCVYCYEGDLKRKNYMSQETAVRLVHFIDNFSQDADDAHIDFYGGEPLLSLDMIKSISSAFKALSEKTNRGYAFGLVTNGALLTKKTVEELVPLGLKSARITLDGPRENHNKFRPFKTGAGSFDVIIRNIKETCGLININIGGAYTSDNYRKFPGLLDYMLDEGLTPDKIASVKFDPVTASPFNRSEFKSGCSSINESWLFAASIFLREEILSRGFSTPKVQPATCMIELDNSIAVNHDGAILKCPALMGYGLEAGNIFTGLSDYKKSHKLDIWKNADCLACEYLPICYGGCRYMKLLKNGRLDGVDCKRQYLDANLEALIKQDLNYCDKLDQAPH